MPIPTAIGDLSTTIASNSPAGADSATEGDNYLRAHAAFIAELRNRTNKTQDLLSFEANAYDGTTDCAAAFAAAFAAGGVVRVSGVCLIKSRINATGKWILMEPGAAITLDMTTFTGDRTTSTGCGVLFDGDLRGGIDGGAIRPNTFTDDRLCIAVRVVSSTETRISGVDFSGFSKANGIVSIDTSDAVLVTGCLFRDCYMNVGTTGQITGINVDDNRVGGVGSFQPMIIGNIFRNLVVGAAFIAARGYESDGINLQFCRHAVVANNTFSGMGEGIDLYGDRASITGNTISDSYIYGIKLIHGASRNVITGNSIYESGYAGITVGGTNSGTQDTEQNLIANNNIQGIDPDGNWSAQETACIQFSDQAGTTYLPRHNVVRGNFLNPGVGKWCINRIGCTGGNNWFTDNHFQAVGASGYVLENGGDTGRVTASNKTSVRVSITPAQTIATTVTAKLTFNSEIWDDRAEFDTTTNRFTCKIPGVYRFSGSLEMGSISTANSLIRILTRVNGATMNDIRWPAVAGRSLPISAHLLELSEGDYVELWITNGDTGDIGINNDSGTTYLCIEQA